MASISVIIPSYNRPHLLGKALLSISSQTRLPDEVVVVDDGSNDKRANQEVIKKSRNVLNIKYIYQENQGVSTARNNGIACASGDLIAFLDDDDIWASQKLEKEEACFKNNPADVGVVCCWTRMAKKNGNVSILRARNFKTDILSELLQHCFIAVSAPLIKADLLEEYGVFDPELDSCEDWDLWVRLAQHTKFAEVPEILTEYIKHDGFSLTGSVKVYSARKKYYEKNEDLYLQHNLKDELCQMYMKLVFKFMQYNKIQKATECYKKAVSLSRPSLGNTLKFYRKRFRAGIQSLLKSKGSGTDIII